jgi:probable F420-dependent oxidoreductase
MTLRIGAKVPSSGDLPEALGITDMARRLEEAGFASLWCSDHIVMTERADRSYYPFSDDGQPSWDPSTPWYDAVVAMSMMAAGTSRTEIGVAVLVLPLRHPVTFAKQIASIDRLAGGRITLGVGAGWYREEYEALDVPFSGRGKRLEEWIDTMRDCWTGRPAARPDGLHALPGDVVFSPRPAGDVPVLVGGLSDVALRRAARHGGWLGLQRAGHLDADAMAASVRSLHAHAEQAHAEQAHAGEAGRDPADLRVVLRVIESAGRADTVAAAVPSLVAAGVTEIIVDTEWDDGGDAESVHATLSAAAQAAGPAGTARSARAGGHTAETGATGSAA